MKNPDKTIYLNIARFIIRICFYSSEWRYAKEKLLNNICEYYQGFIMSNLPKKIHYTIKVEQKKQLQYHRKKDTSFIEIYFKKEKTINTFYQISLIQFQLILNDILNELLAQNNGFVLHASANSVKNHAVIFVASSGGGKSTIMKILHPQYTALADDTVIIRKIEENYYLFQTPNIEKENWVRKSSVKFPIEKILFLNKARECHMSKLKENEVIVERMLKQIITDKLFLTAHIKNMTDFISRFQKFYFLYFVPNKKILAYF